MKFKKPIEVQAGISDGDPTNPLGQAGYLLSSDGSNVNWVSPGGLSAETAEAIVQPIKANEALAKGDPVYIVGFNNGQNTNIVAKADSSDPTKMPVVGLADDDYASQAFGTMTAFGSFNGAFDTTGGTENWTIGDIIFVKPGGGLTNIKPVGTDLIQNVAIVSRVNSQTGELEVIALGRTNDVPNLPTGRLFVGTAANTSLASDVVYVDDANDRVGIGTTNPSTDLEVSSTGVNGVDISQSASNASQSGRLFFTTNTASEGFALFNSNGTFQVNSGGIPNNTSGTNRISIIGSSGNVGIGTTSPSTKLHVSGGDIRIDDTEQLQFGAGGVAINNDAAGRMYSNAPLGYYWQAASSYKMVLLSSGNLGIGTTIPGSKLTVNGSTNLGGNVEVSDGLGGDKTLTLNANIGHFSIGDIDGLGDQAFISGDSSSISISTNQITTLHCDSNNRVGIGVTIPSQKLHVNGNARLTGLFYDGTNSGGTNGQILSSDGGQTEWIDGSAIPGVPAGSGTINYLARWTPDANTLGIGVTYDNGTNVGIGTTSPTTKLDVYGNLRLGTTGDFNISQSPFLTTVFYVTGGGNGGTITFGAPASNTQNVSVQGDFHSYQGSIGTKLGSASFNNKISYNGDNYLNSGNLGIGTTSPQEKLHVSGSSNVRLEVEATDSTVAALKLTNTAGSYASFVDASGSLNTYDYNAASVRTTLLTNGSFGIATTTPQSRLQVNGGIQLAFDGSTPSLAKVGTFRYRKSGNNTYVDMCMQTGASTYAWVNIVTNSW